VADFHQTGAITTLHRLGRPDWRRLEADLLRNSRTRPISLVLPCLYAELHGPG
jgi:glucosyl-3-phosphoglycerate synthase